MVACTTRRSGGTQMAVVAPARRLVADHDDRRRVDARPDGPEVKVRDAVAVAAPRSPARSRLGRAAQATARQGARGSYRAAGPRTSVSPAPRRPRPSPGRADAAKHLAAQTGRRSPASMSAHPPGRADRRRADCDRGDAPGWSPMIARGFLLLAGIENAPAWSSRRCARAAAARRPPRPASTAIGIVVSVRRGTLSAGPGAVARSLEDRALG